jgi:hypothetical protein
VLHLVLSDLRCCYIDGPPFVKKERLPPILRLSRGTSSWTRRIAPEDKQPGQHFTLAYGEYANRVRGSRRPPETDTAN